MSAPPDAGPVRKARQRHQRPRSVRGPPRTKRRPPAATAPRRRGASPGLARGRPGQAVPRAHWPPKAVPSRAWPTPCDYRQVLLRMPMLRMRTVLTDPPPGQMGRASEASTRRCPTRPRPAELQPPRSGRCADPPLAGGSPARRPQGTAPAGPRCRGRCRRASRRASWAVVVRQYQRVSEPSAAHRVGASAPVPASSGQRGAPPRAASREALAEAQHPAAPDPWPPTCT
mmetsp:Transcript_38184/g.109598  ORF Transcript_38184/g.109598 Transcript_38184/m.109598 type:complete len:229 (+) Transcript_38184:879-1565(+)